MEMFQHTQMLVWLPQSIAVLLRRLWTGLGTSGCFMVMMTPCGLWAEFWICWKTWTLICPMSSQVGQPCSQLLHLLINNNNNKSAFQLMQLPLQKKLSTLVKCKCFSWWNRSLWDTYTWVFCEAWYPLCLHSHRTLCLTRLNWHRWQQVGTASLHGPSCECCVHYWSWLCFECSLIILHSSCMTERCIAA